MENLLGYAAEEVLGERCWKVLCGRDAFGNIFCNEFCNVRRAFSRNESVHGFELDVRKASGETARVWNSTLVVRGGRPSQCINIHLLRAAGYAECAEPGAGQSCPTHANTTLLANADGCPKLTARQVEILRYFAKGLSSKAVASALGISALTVRTHTRNILRDCSVHNIRQAILLAQRHGLT